MPALTEAEIVAAEREKEKLKVENALRRGVRARREAGFLRDRQQMAVYRWQERFGLTGYQCDWTLDQCRRFVSHIWHAYFGNNAHPPRIKGGRGSVTAHANRFAITLPLWARHRQTVLHELAHAMLEAWGYHGTNSEGHGAEWTRMFIELLASYANYGRVDLLRWAREFGLEVAPRNVVPKRRRCAAMTLADCAKSAHYRHEKEDAWMRKGRDRIIIPKKRKKAA